MEARLKEEARRRGVSFEEALNTALRAGLTGGRSATRYVVSARSMGLRPNVNLDEALQLAAEMEDTGCRSHRRWSSARRFDMPTC